MSDMLDTEACVGSGIARTNAALARSELVRHVGSPCCAAMSMGLRMTRSSAAKARADGHRAVVGA